GMPAAAVPANHQRLRSKARNQRVHVAALAFRSRRSLCPPLLRALGDLPHGALGIARQNLRALVSALRSDLGVAEIGVSAFGEAAVPERRESQFLAQPRGAEDRFDLAAHVREIDIVWHRPGRPWGALRP